MTQALETLLLREIRLARAMGLTVKKASPLEVVLEAPLDPNINHEGTAFGGSLHSAALLACWCLAGEALRGAQLGHVVVVKEATTRYLRPVDGLFEARCAWTLEESKDFLRGAREEGRGRARLQSEVFCKGVLSASFSGTFIAKPASG